MTEMKVHSTLYTVIFYSMNLLADLARMYSLVSRVPYGMTELRKKFESHVHSRGLNGVEKCGDTVANVSHDNIKMFYFEYISVHEINSIICIVFCHGQASSPQCLL